jgi:N,N'-diacetylchitobiose phosphorylase
MRPGFDGLIIDPCIPADWKEFAVTRQWRGATYNIKVKNPSGVQKGVKSATLNGKPIQGPVPLQKAGTDNEVVVEMG